MIRKTIALLVLAGLLMSCQKRDPRDTGAVDPNTEIAANPQLLLDWEKPVDQMTLKGVGINASRDAIRSARIYNESRDGWIMTLDGCRYRILDGRVVTLGVWDQAILDQLGVKTQADVERVFGKAQSVESVDSLQTKMTLYRYADGQRRVSWDHMTNRLAAVNLGSATYIPPATKPAE